jgi:hypothetical protein
MFEVEPRTQSYIVPLNTDSKQTERWKNAPALEKGASAAYERTDMRGIPSCCTTIYLPSGKLIIQTIREVFIKLRRQDSPTSPCLAKDTPRQLL